MLVLAKDKELLAKDLEISIKELLSANGLLTSRGMFEWLLKKAFYELNTKGKFNASEMIRTFCHQPSRRRRLPSSSWRFLKNAT